MTTMPVLKRLNVVTGACLLGCLVLAYIVVGTYLQTARNDTLVEPAMAQLILHYSVLPRIAIAALAGLALGLAGFLLQQVMQNDLASPMTLGVASGARFALMMATLFSPALLRYGNEWVAFAGALAGIGLVFALTWRRGLSPHIVILAGLVVNLFIGALSAIFLIFYPEQLRGVLLWGTGSLQQQGWSDSIFLLVRLVFVLPLVWLLMGPMQALQLNDVSAKSLGISVKHVRLGAVAIASFLTACVISIVGVIGFIGLAAPAIARVLGARTIAQRCLYAMVVGCILLMLADLSLTLISQHWPNSIGTGSVTALLGAPVLLWLILREKSCERFEAPPVVAPVVRASAQPAWGLAGLGLLLAALLLVALYLGKDAHLQWEFDLHSPAGLVALRAPRVLIAVAAGLILAVAGVLLQRTSDNPMAAPELLGITSGTGIGVLLALMSGLAASQSGLFLYGLLGAAGALALVVAINLNNRLNPEKVLLTGLAIAALLDTIQNILLASGDPRAQQVLTWLSGSTYRAPQDYAWTVLAAALVLCGLAMLAARVLTVMGLGNVVARELGLHLTLARLALFFFSAVLTAMATFLVGPLTFVGLMAPHMARMMGFTKPAWQLAAAAVLGAATMTSADFLGRQLLFPYEIPAGLLATILGGGYFLWMMRKPVW